MPVRDKPTLRSKAKSGQSVLQSMAGLRPEHVAFLGEYAAATDDKQLFVQILCWPTVSSTWSTLAETIAGLQAMRGDNGSAPAARGKSWLHDAAPRLCQPIDRELNAVESTLATFIRRLPLRFAVAVVEQAAGQQAASDTSRSRSLFTGCLTAYGAYLKSSRQSACRVVIASAGESGDNDARRGSYDEVLMHVDGADQIGALELAFWNDPSEPLPMEVARLAAAAVGRHLEHPAQNNPLFETVRAHLAPPSRFHALSRQRGKK